MSRRTGRWIATAPTLHACRPPGLPLLLPWLAGIGARWQCECSREWVLGRRHPSGSRVWLDARPAWRLRRYREATPAEINYWIARELNCQLSDGGEFQPGEVIHALQKHFMIGVEE